MKQIVLAVSGGCDSMYLASRASDFFPGVGVIVAHCNFRLRGAESDADEEFVRTWCLDHGVEFICKRFDTAVYAQENGLSIEMAARELRYTWFAELCSHSDRALAVAHNAGDNAETLILNILRGTGSKGLRGMSSDSVLYGMRILRPMLGISREEIESWMLSNHIPWREDSSNFKTEYKRNKIRNKVFPVFKEINPSFVRTVRDDIARFCQVDDIAEDYFSSAMEQIKTDNGGFSVVRLLEQKHWKYLLWRIVEDSGISAPTFEKMISLFEKYRNSPSGTVTMGGKTFETPSCKLFVKKKVLYIENSN